MTSGGPGGWQVKYDFESISKQKRKRSTTLNYKFTTEEFKQIAIKVKSGRLGLGCSKVGPRQRTPRAQHNVLTHNATLGLPNVLCSLNKNFM